jgi:CheY-like chemotaxis protein
MLIDDNKVDLFVNEKMIEKIDANSKIKSFTSGVSAINYLKILESSPRCQSIFAPDIIFLDINMPNLNGFQFLNAYSKLKIDKKDRIKIYMLSSSTNMDDINKAKKHKYCIGFINKPLTIRAIEEIIFQFNQDLKRNEFQNDNNMSSHINK